MLAAVLLALGVTPITPIAAGDPGGPPTDTGHLADQPITPIPHPAGEDPARTKLGATLFADTRLSGNGRSSCSSCHDLRTNGATANRFDQAPGGAKLAVNSPTVFNTALNFRQTWSGSLRTLEQQAQASIEDPAFMATSLDAVSARLAADPAMVDDFRMTYGHGPDGASVVDALATFERTLLTPDSPFDRWLQGKAALDPDAVAGYDLFRSIGCISCHQGRNVGGNLFERAGIFRALDDAKRPLMRVPSLRNVAVTPPYFRGGTAATLPDAVRTMADVQLGRSLSDAQTAQIVVFLTSLTGQYQGHSLGHP